MGKLARIGPDLNAFTLRFDEGLLDGIRDSYHRELHSILTNPQNQRLFAGGREIRQPFGAPPNEYFLVSFLTYPLLWLSCNTPETYQVYQRFFDGLGIEDELKKLVDHDSKIVLYCGFLVAGYRSPGHSWHLDYLPGANAYSLLTPLFELDPGHGNLLYKVGDKVNSHGYEVGEAIMFGDKFMHCTEPYDDTGHLRVLVSLQFGTDKMEYWNTLRQTIESQSNYLVLPCGHRLGTCQCVGQVLSTSEGINSGFPLSRE
jgi:hypothetical protein